MIVASPAPTDSSHSLIVAMPSSTDVMPSSDTSPFDELTYGASPMNASGQWRVSSVGLMWWAANHSSGGRWIGGMSRP